MAETQKISFARALCWVHLLTGVGCTMLISSVRVDGWQWVQPTVVNGLLILAAIPLAILARKEPRQ